MRLETVSDAELETLADTEQPQGVVAVVEPRPWRLEDLRPAAGRPVVVLDAVQDPGNVGAILRTTLGLGGAGVVALKGTADLHNAKVVRGSMGALFRLPAVAADATAYLAWAKAAGVETWVATADGEPLGRRCRRRRSGPGRAGPGQRGRRCRRRALGRGTAAGGDPARARGRIAQRGGGGGHPSLRGRAWCLTVYRWASWWGSRRCSAPRSEASSTSASFAGGPSPSSRWCGRRPAVPGAAAR